MQNTIRCQYLNPGNIRPFGLIRISSTNHNIRQPQQLVERVASTGSLPTVGLVSCYALSATILYVVSVLLRQPCPTPGHDASCNMEQAQASRLVIHPRHKTLIIRTRRKKYKGTIIIKSRRIKAQKQKEYKERSHVETSCSSWRPDW